ncbi:MAG: 3-oxoacyl-[acyl-carrier-protein] reductase [Ignavibacteria bacterium RBG_13_36_8]|nr:MAG: 3-oxoacyl-[acyl-carrier-protein] reductase [Ignavibacteria bacterium RBG_13_36_8]
MNFQNKKAVVTGGSRGIGRAIVKELANHGCHVILSDIVFGDETPEQLTEDIKKELTSNDSKIYAFKADATSFTDAQATIDFAVEKLGGVDFLVNNAGITKDNLLLRMSEEDFDKVIQVNLKSVFNYTKAVLKPMMNQRYGRIVNIASVVGIIGNAGQANYVASKAGIIGMTKSNAKELASRNITVNAIAPGFIQTSMTDKLNEKQKEAMLSLIPLKRMGKPEDIAKVVCFLCSEYADYLTGQVITVDGGMVM